MGGFLGWSRAAKRPGAASVCVIGAGLSGLAAAHALAVKGIEFVCLEKGSDVGGIWRQPQAGERSPVYPSLHLNTSKRLTGYSDFPMPASYPIYPRHSEMAAYLRSFAEWAGLLDRIELGTEVVSVRPEPGGSWTVVSRDTNGSSTSRTFEQVIVASGHTSEPLLPNPSPSGSQSFTGTALHSIDYPGGSDFRGKRVVVVGLGASAVDIAADVSRHASQTVISVRRGLHIIPKQLYGVSVDEIPESEWWTRMSLPEQRDFIERALHVARGKLADYGLPEPDHQLFSSAVTISDEILSRIRHGAVIPKPAIESIAGSRVVFSDGTSVEADVIIYCTGYSMAFPFLPVGCPIGQQGAVELYRRIAAPDHPGLHFVGLVRPVGAIARVLEAQARWVARVIGGEVALPVAEVMHKEIGEYLSGIAGRYGQAVGATLHVDVVPYLQDLGNE